MATVQRGRKGLEIKVKVKAFATSGEASHLYGDAPKAIGIIANRPDHDWNGKIRQGEPVWVELSRHEALQLCADIVLALKDADPAQTETLA